MPWPMNPLYPSPRLAVWTPESPTITAFVTKTWGENPASVISIPADRLSTHLKFLNSTWPVVSEIVQFSPLLKPVKVSNNDRIGKFVA